MTILFNTMVLSFLKVIFTVVVLKLFQRIQHNALTELSENLSEENAVLKIDIICYTSVWFVVGFGSYAIYHAFIVFQNAIYILF